MVKAVDMIGIMCRRYGMTESEAKLIESMTDGYSNVLKEAKSMDCKEIRALYNITLKNMELIINALEKQIPKEPNFGHNLSDNVSLFICKCGNKIKVHHDSGIFDNNDAPNYCKNCGQKLDWSDSD